MRSSSFLWLLLLYLFFVQLNVYTDPLTNSSLNFYHLLLPVYFLFLYIPSRRVFLNPLVLFFMVSSFFNFIAYLNYGFSVKFVQFFLCVISSYVGYCFVNLTTCEQRVAIYSKLGILVLLSLLIRDIIYISSISEIYSRSRNVGDVFFLSSGGRNIEVTLLGLLSMLIFKNKKLYYLIITVAVLSSVLMMSRAGLVTAMISLFLFFKQSSNSLTLKVGFGSLFMSLVVISLLTFSDNISESEFLGRFNIENDLQLANEDQGRVALWRAAFEAISHNYFGYGVGNGVKESILLGGIDIRENNIHNIYIQYLLELGVFSLFLFIILSYKSFVLNVREKVPEGYVFCTFLLLGSFQFTGYEPFIWFFSGSLFYYFKKNYRGSYE